jgi:hypothetical protein
MDQLLVAMLGDKDDLLVPAAVSSPADRAEDDSVAAEAAEEHVAGRGGEAEGAGIGPQPEARRGGRHRSPPRHAARRPERVIAADQRAAADTF